LKGYITLLTPPSVGGTELYHDAKKRYEICKRECQEVHIRLLHKIVKCERQLNRKSLLTLIFLTSCLTVLFSAFKVLAHAPLTPGTNESLDTASIIPDPNKSWAIYGELHEGGEAQYYSFSINKGERILISLLKSTASEDNEFLPGFVLMGPNMTGQGTVPSYVEVPEGYDSIVVNGMQPSQATYEPFSPSSFYLLAEIDVNASSTGIYYIAVFEPSHGGHYGLAVGYIEEYTLEEWILLPFSLISVYQWERQSLIVIFAPFVGTLILGLAFMIWRWKTQRPPQTLFAWFATLVGLLFLGTGFMTLLQMAISLAKTSLAPEAIVTLIFALVPILLGTAALRISLRKKEVISRTRIYLAIIGIVALFMWAGLLVGPILAIIGSLLPSRLSIGKSQMQSNKAE